MSLEISGVRDAGVPNKERIEMRVLLATDLAYFLVAEGTLVGDGVGVGALNTFWFPSTAAQPGETVLLFTGPGTNTKYPATLLGGAQTHVFYWGREKTLFSRLGSAAMLFEVKTWSTSRPLSSAFLFKK